jgi:predicted RNA-binding Zn-ribbon protein involved in translation (DUF1610 family)
MNGATCPKCSAAVVVPDEVSNFECPACKATVHIAKQATTLVQRVEVTHEAPKAFSNAFSGTLGVMLAVAFFGFAMVFLTCAGCNAASNYGAQHSERAR